MGAGSVKAKGVSSLPTLTYWETTLRIMLALLLCGLVGLERERRGQVAGMRTHILVGVGSALFTLISAYAFAGWIVETNSTTRPAVIIDPSRVAAQIVAGIGFLGAGAIITQGVTVRGLTTAATLWVSAAIGMACGVGFYFPVIITTVIVFLALIGVRRLRSALAQRIRANVVFLEARVKNEKRLGQLLALFVSHGVSLQRMDPMRKNRYHFELLVPADMTLDQLEEILESLKGVRLRSIQAARADANFI